MTVECVFGHLSKRFKVLKDMELPPDSVNLVITACVHLHNFIRCWRLNDPIERLVLISYLALIYFKDVDIDKS